MPKNELKDHYYYYYHVFALNDLSESWTNHNWKQMRGFGNVKIQQHKINLKNIK